MTQPANTPQQGSDPRRAWTLVRVCYLIAFACFLIASLDAAGVIFSSLSQWAFGFGGFAAWMLAAVV